MKKPKLVLILNIILIIIEIIGLVLSFKETGFTLKYFTQDSNILALLIAFIFTFYLLTKKKIPKWLSLLKYVAATSLALTFLVVIFILTPTMKEIGGLGVMLFSGSMLYLHTLAPLIAITSFVFFENCNVKTYKDSFFAISFTVLYGIISTILNITKIMYGPYQFLYVYEQSLLMSIIWFIVIIGGSYLIAYILKLLSKRFNK